MKGRLKESMGKWNKWRVEKKKKKRCSPITYQNQKGKRQEKDIEKMKKHAELYLKG